MDSINDFLKVHCIDEPADDFNDLSPAIESKYLAYQANYINRQNYPARIPYIKKYYQAK